MEENQAFIFAVFTLVGIIIGIIFDIFRIIRKIIKTPDIITNIEDIIFWIITGTIIVCTMYKFCAGQLRFFMIIGIAIGGLIYLFTISNFFIGCSIFIINILKKILYYPIRIVKIVLKKIFINPIIFICINLRKNVKKYKKNRGFFWKKEKYNNI